MKFDAIIVGARCAGAPLAIHLCRAGQKVLLLDQAKLPSDQPLSTHFIQAKGVDWLDELGVGKDVRRLSPPSHVACMSLGGSVSRVTYQHGRAAHCIRRIKLDPLLQEAAASAGADLRDETKVVGLLREGDRVTGVEAVSNGRREQYTAPVVVGADGRYSTVAELAGAREYIGYDNPRFGYWAYWPAPRAWREDPFLSKADMLIEYTTDRCVRFVFQCDDDLLLIGITPLNEDLPTWKGDHAAQYHAGLRRSPHIAKLVADNEPVGKIIGLTKLRYFMREAAGPGFALVGDAGLHKDPTPGIGITDALRDAKNLSRAILEGGDRALQRYWRQRDVDSIELFHFASDMADPSYLSPLNQLVIGRVGRAPELAARMARVFDRELSPYNVLSPLTVLSWTLGAALRGNFAVVKNFLETGKRGAEVAKLLAERQALLDAV